MEYRVFLKIGGLSVRDESRWEPLIEWLERHEQELGPVIGFGEGGAEIVVSMPSDGEAAAVKRAVVAVSAALDACHLERLYPTSVAVEEVPSEELASA